MSNSFMNDQLSRKTSIFGLSLWVVLGVSVGAAFVIILCILSLCLISKRKHIFKNKNISNFTIPNPNLCRDIQEIRVDHPNFQESENPHGVDQQALILRPNGESPVGYSKIQIEIGKDHKISYSPSNGNIEEGRSSDHPTAVVIPQVSHLGWGHWYTLRELEASTNGFSHENVIGEGGYGIVYYGLLQNSTQIAVKNLLNNRGQAEKEFEVEVEAIGRVRHKNLVRLLGYCAEGASRVLVYEYVNNGNLEQWLHGDSGPSSPLTWEIRMNIILGTAKGLSYLHEGLEPKVVHRDIKSSNILLDKHWHPKVSDFGLAKLLGSDTNFIQTRVMGTFGYVAPEYANTGMLNDKSDVYSFGVLIMEIISGRNPVDHSREPEEVNLVDWLRQMVADRNPERVLDPKLTEKPSSRALKRILLVALRCVDPNSQKRPKMGNVVHMIEAEESPYKDRRAGRIPSSAHHDVPKDTMTLDKQGKELVV